MNRWFDLVSIRTAAMAMNKFHPKKIIEVKYFLMQVLDLTHIQIQMAEFEPPFFIDMYRHYFT